jgi:hypothetical protein
VHTRMRLVVAPTRAWTGLRFTFQRRLVTLWAWLMRFPNCGFLPQISHCCAMTAIDPFRGLGRNYYSTGFGRVQTILRLGATKKIEAFDYCEIFTTEGTEEHGVKQKPPGNRQSAT